jgi:MFS family permease
VTPILAPLVNDPSAHVLGAHSSVESRHIVYGLIQALSPLCYMLGAPILGYLSDRVGRRKILLFCIGGSFVGLLAYILSFNFNSLLILLFGRVIVGFTSGSLAVAQSAIADISKGAAKAKNIGLIAVAMTIGLIAGPLLGGVLSDPSVVSWFTNSTPFYAGIVLSVANLIILLTMLDETHMLVSTDKSHGLLRDFWRLLTQYNLQYILLSFFVFELGWSLYFQSLALLLAQHFHLANKMIGVFSSYVGLVLSLFLLYGVRVVVNRFELVKIVKPSYLLGIIVLLIGFFFNTMTMQWLIAIPISLMVAFCYTIFITMGSDKVDSNMQGLYMGVTDGLLSLAFAITAFLGSVLAIKSAIVPELVAAGFFAFGLLLFPLAQRQYQQG